MLLERKSSQACMNKVYFILSNKGGGGGFEHWGKKKNDAGEELKMAAPLSFFKCTMTTRAESQLLLIKNKQERAEPELTDPKVNLQGWQLESFCIWEVRRGKTWDQNKTKQLSPHLPSYISNWSQLKPLNLVAGNATEVKGTYVTQENPSLLHFLQEKSC